MIYVHHATFQEFVNKMKGRKGIYRKLTRILALTKTWRSLKKKAKDVWRKVPRNLTKSAKEVGRKIQKKSEEKCERSWKKSANEVCRKVQSCKQIKVSSSAAKENKKNNTPSCSSSEPTDLRDTSGKIPSETEKISTKSNKIILNYISWEWKIVIQYV